MAFDTLYSRQKKSSDFISNSGSPDKAIYEYRDIDGIKTLVKTDQVTSLYDLIQSHSDETDINVIIKRFINGDDSALIARKGAYGDFTNFPSTYAELYQRLQECENVFNSLPVDIRSAFDHSASKFWSEFGDEHFNSVFTKYIQDFKNDDSIPVPSVPNESEVK